MKYFIGYLIQDEAAVWHTTLSKNISEKFSTWKIHEKHTPHITIYYLAEIENIELIKIFLRNWIQNKKVPGNFAISGFGRFEDRIKSFLDDLKRDYGGNRVMIIGHRATQYGLDHLINGVPLEQLVSSHFKWQPGWEYNV